MVKCAVLSCKNNNKKKLPGVSFHSFPVCQQLKNTWLKAICRTEFTPNRGSRVCSVHFKEDDLNKTLQVIRLKDGVCPTLLLPVCMNSSHSPAPSTSKRQRFRKQHETKPMDDSGEDDDEEEEEHDNTNYKTEQDRNLELPRTHLQGRAPPSYKCNVCSADIEGFRYTCLQCVDWDMCMACEMRGEHPEHYVLRSPAPSSYAENGQVLAVIRKHIEDLLQQSKEMTEDEIFIKEEITIKEEMIEEEPVDSLVASHSTPAMNYRSVPEVDEHKEGQSEYVYFIRSSLPTDQETRNSSTNLHPLQSEVKTGTILQHFVNEATVPIVMDQPVSQDNEEQYSVTIVQKPFD